MKILNSASKTVFVLVALSACIALFTGNLTPDNFMVLATGAFAFYFSNKPTNSAGEIVK